MAQNGGVQDDLEDTRPSVANPTAPAANVGGEVGDTVLVHRAEPRHSEAGLRQLPGQSGDALLPDLVEPPARPRSPMVAPPEFYRFRIADTVVVLDAICWIGRKPRRPRVLDGRMPRLVHVPSASHQVSGTHLEIRQRGTSVVVTDLRSTNGSVVNVPGNKPATLRRGESMVVSPGTLVDIGDGNLIEILPMQRL